MSEYPNEVFADHDPFDELDANTNKISLIQWEEQRDEEIREILRDCGIPENELDNYTPEYRENLLIEKYGERMEHLAFPEQTR